MTKNSDHRPFADPQSNPDRLAAALLKGRPVVTWRKEGRGGGRGVALERHGLCWVDGCLRG